MEFSKEEIVVRINTTREGSSRCTVAIVDRPPNTVNPFDKDIPSFG